jgi:hypothetical protein
MPERAHSEPHHRPPRRPGAPATAAATGDAERLLELQRRAGNKAVTGIVDGTGVVQRVEVKGDPYSETLYNQSGAGGKAGSKKFSLTPNFVLDRKGDTGLTVKVRVKFMHQGRRPDKSMIGEPAEIPANDPDDRRGWAQNLVKEQTKPWNGHVALVGEERNVIADNTKKRLPVTFEAVAVFTGDDYDNIVIIHPQAVAAGTPGQVIDAGNYYINKGTYSSDEKVIAAHEYGHLIGIPDEYSQSNVQMNALLHQAAPKTAPSAHAALERATVERMVLVAMRRPLLVALDAAMPSVTDALRAKRAAVKKQMAAAARAGVTAAGVRSELENQLAAKAETRLAPAVPRAVAFETTRNFSNKSLADSVVETGFTAAGLTTLIRDAYWKSLGAAEDAKVVAVEGLGDVSIDVQGSVRGTTSTGAPQAGAAAAAATSEVGTAGGPVTFFGMPLVAPPSGLIGQLMAAPATWGTAGSALEAGVTAAAFSTKMEAILKAVGALESLIGRVLPGPPAPTVQKTRELYAKAYGMVNAAATEASTQLAADLLTTVIPPVITGAVGSLQTSIKTEVDRVMGTPPSGMAAAANPTMNAMVAAMKARMDADKAASAGGGRDPLGAGKAAPDQDVTYSYQGLMGSHGTMKIREDQLAPLVKQFNAHCTNMWEKDFRAEVK